MNRGRARLTLIAGGVAAGLAASLLVVPGCAKQKVKPAGEAPVPTQEKTPGVGATGTGAATAPEGPKVSPRAMGRPKSERQATGGAKMGTPGGG